MEEGTNPNVNFGAGIGFSLEHFGRRVGGTAAKGVQSVVKGVEIGEAKVRKFYLEVGVQKQILCLKVHGNISLLWSFFSIFSH